MDKLIRPIQGHFRLAHENSLNPEVLIGLDNIHWYPGGSGSEAATLKRTKPKGWACRRWCKQWR